MAIRMSLTIKQNDQTPRSSPLTAFYYVDDATVDAAHVALAQTFAANLNGKLMSVSKQIYVPADQSLAAAPEADDNGGTDRVILSYANRTVTPNVVSRMTFPAVKRNVDTEAFVDAFELLLPIGISDLALGERFEAKRVMVTPP